MKRAPFVIGATGVGLGLLLSFHTKPVHVNIAATGTSPDTGSNPGGGTPGSTPPASTATGGGSSPTTAPANPSRTATSQLIQ